MDMFEKVTKVAKNVGETVVSSAKNIGTSIYSTTKEQGELASYNVQKHVIQKKLEESYAEIGKRYVDYIGQCEGDKAFDVEDILEKIRPELEKLEDVKNSIAEKEQQIKLANEAKLQKKAEDEFEAEKSKLDKALAMEIINEDEYASKLSVAQSKLDNYELLRKIDMQLEMGIITKEEHAEKINSIIG